MLKLLRSRKKRDTSSQYKLSFFGKIRNVFYSFGRSLGRFLGRFFAFVPPGWINSAGKAVYHGNERVKLQDYFNPIYWLIWSWGFVIHWTLTRPYMNLGPAILAVGVGGLILMLSVRQALESRDWRGQMYAAVASEAAAAGDDKLQHLALVNLIAKYPDNINYRLQQAALADKQGQAVEARRMYATLVTTYKDPWAAFWLVNNGFDLKSVKSWTPDQHREFLSLASMALGIKNAQVDYVRAKLAQYLLDIGAPEDAAQHLSQIASSNPELRLITAALYDRIGDRQQCLKWATAAQDYYDSQLLKQPDNVQARLLLAQTLLLMEQEERAARMLAEGAKVTQDQTLYDAGAVALVHWVRRIVKQTPNRIATIPHRIQLLQSAIRISPRSEVALDAVIEIAIECREVKDPQVLAARAKLVATVDPQIGHFIEGTIDLLAGKTASAESHFEIASKNGDNFPGLMNNLAVTLANRNPPELDRALDLANSALKYLPKHPYVLETRGQILLKLKRYQEGISDLEVALSAPELAQAIHRSLAEAYSALGQKDQAAIHLKFAENLTGR